MDRCTFLAGCAGFGFAAFAEAGDAAKSPQAIDRLIKQLGSKTFREREAAGRELEKVGEAALPALRKSAKDDADAEVRRRAGELVERLEVRLGPVLAKRIIASKLSEKEKGRQLQPLVKPGMTREQVHGILRRPRMAMQNGTLKNWRVLNETYDPFRLQVDYGPDQRVKAVHLDDE